ncbi:class I SAM-dependent methyltransferase [Streptomyces qinzhouensis]|uniref:Class I SAM-dependent methyltransferase n=1 Tax=Streptomyces qinzhouensis TaxID=2599401 RepID=A0A5B8JIV5_9ACTN|nr:class I SAM-dependent methyltransferase [Streptomyces qinzhouensis]QDY79831.1 class I SAM-dependent methyltransferase [Streptomyces qinzhouensis]
MSVTSRYWDAWESFWSEVPGAEPGEVFWDAEPALTSGLHLALYEPLVDAPGLPLVDLGCGNGTQTFCLAGRFPTVIGVDLSPAAIALANRALAARETPPDHDAGGVGIGVGVGDDGGMAGSIRFGVLDATDGEAVAALHAETGDCNVYMRGVLHQTDPKDRQTLADSIAVLIGDRGRAFVVELAEAAGRQLARLAQLPDGPPPKLKPVFRHGIVPGAVADSDVADFFAGAGLTVLAGGELPLTTTEYEPDGSRIELPSTWLVVGRE